MEVLNVTDTIYIHMEVLNVTDTIYMQTPYVYGQNYHIW